MANLVNEYMNKPVRVALGSTSKPADTVELQAFEIPRRNRERLSKRRLGLGIERHVGGLPRPARIGHRKTVVVRIMLRRLGDRRLRFLDRGFGRGGCKSRRGQ